MLDNTWEALDPGGAGLAEARLILHQAVQPVAAVGQTLAPRAEDDSQQSLRVEGPRAWHGVPVTGSALQAGLDPVGLVLWLGAAAGPPLASLPLVGRTLPDALAFLSDELGRRAGPVTLALPAHPDGLGEHPLAGGAPFTEGDPAARRELARLFAGSADLLAGLAGPSGSPLRLWPHHFDLATSVAVGGCSVGLGVSPGEGPRGLPYWYASPWPAPPLDALPPLEAGGTWHTGGWMGAELGLARLGRGAAAQRAQVLAFFRSALAALSPPEAALRS